MITLGPFELEQPIGAGGMGEIWRALHRATGVPVAIKVIQAEAGGEFGDEFKDAFLHEVRLVAGLRHRNVVMALDAGTLPESAEVASEGRLKAGAPFLAMELAGGGSLAGRRVESWRELRHVLVQLLDGLAHAHARGIVHRDVKPGNLLLATERGTVAGGVPASLLDARIVVTDFGIGSDRVGRDLYASGAAIGTPTFMAPEQVEAEWRDHGPWTDLYAAGVLGFQLSTGAPPFRGPTAALTMVMHLTHPVPPLQPLFDVPSGFDAFVRQLLSKRPEDRFRFAADARRALVALGDPEVGDRKSARRRSMAAPDLPTPPPARREDPGRDFLLEGAGLGLYGLREVPLVGRMGEREALWDALVRVRDGGRTRVVVLRGPTGTGKSRLVEWLGRIAHELGAAVAIKAVPGAGLGQLAEGALRCEGLEREPLLDRVGQFLGDRGEAGITELVAQILAPDRFPELPPPTRKETHAALELLLRLHAGDRSVVVWLEDAHLQPEALAFAKRMLDAREPVPALLLLTVQEEALAELSESQELLTALLAEPEVTELTVGRLRPDEHQELVQVLIGLEGGLALRVEEKTEGNPLFAVQLVGDWVARGLLVPSERGFRLREGADPARIPDDLLEVWEDHVARMLRDRGDDDAQALELAATLGLELRQIDFRVLCVLARLKPAPDLVAELMRRRLAQPVGDREQRWMFSHGMLREVLQRRARAAGRWAAHHKVCASHVRTSRKGDAERLARHLLEAGELAEALEPMIQAIGDRLNRGDTRSSALLVDLESALRTLALPETDPRWGSLWLSWAWLLRDRGDHAEAERFAVRCERAARRHGWRELLGRALRLGARIERNLGHSDEALALAREAEALFRAEGDLRRAADCRVLTGDLHLHRMEVDEAKSAFEGALAERAGEDEVDAWMGLANCAKQRSDPDGMWSALERAREVATRTGRRSTLAAVSNLEGELARQRGELPLAERKYREAAARFRALDNAGYVYPLLNLGLLLASRGAYGEAVLLLEPLRERAEKGGVRTVPACFARAVLLPCTAGLGDWGVFDEHARWLEEFLAERKLVDGDLARMALLAAELSAAAGRPQAEATAARIASTQVRAPK